MADTRTLFFLAFIILHLYGFFYFVVLHQQRQRQILKQLLSRNNNLYKKQKRLRALRKLRRQKRSYWAQKRSGVWWRNMLDGVLPETEWKKNFRMSRAEVLELASQIEEKIAPDPRSPNWRMVGARKKSP